MNEQLKQWVEKIDALSLRERLLIMLTFSALLIFVWWNFYAQQARAEAAVLAKQNEALSNQVQTTEVALQAIESQMQEGVFSREQERHQRLQSELVRVNQSLEEKTLQLVEPDQMFELMQQLVYRNSGLQLIELRRKSIDSVFKQSKPESGQPQIYRHTLRASFKGGYKKALAYIEGLMQQKSRLLWDSVSLKTLEYPQIQVDIEASTLSDSPRWVGL